MKHLAIAAAIAIAALAAWTLAPRAADAQSGGMIVAKFTSISYCPYPSQSVVAGGHYFAGTSNTVTILPVEHRGWSCSPHTVLSSGRPARQRGDWTISLQTEPGSGGAALAGGELSLPPTFQGARGQSGLTVRDNENDGAWPGSPGRYGHGVVAFTVPSSHAGTVYLHVTVDYYDSAGNALTGEVSFGFEPPVAPVHPAEAAADAECPHLLLRSTRLLLHSRGDGDPNHLFRERSLLDCTAGSTRWVLRQYMAVAPLSDLRRDYAGDCGDVKTVTLSPYETRVNADGRTEYHWRYRGLRYCASVYGSRIHQYEYWNTCAPHHSVAVDVLDRRLMPGTTTVAYHVRATRTNTCHSDRGATDQTRSETYWTTQIPDAVPAPSG